jgi:hypothetical protein
MSSWITGDTVKIEGVLNENTGVITARSAEDQSLDEVRQRGLNGWIKEINKDRSTLTLTWGTETYTLQVTSATRMVVPPINPATLSDFQVGDRVRVRTNGDRTQALIIVALRRADELFLKARTREFKGVLVENVFRKQSMTIKLAGNEHLRSDDVNNLVGIEGESVTVTWDENTKFKCKRSGDCVVERMVAGDGMQIVGRVNDDGTILARLVKDRDLSTTTENETEFRHHFSLTDVNTTTNTIEADELDRTEFSRIRYTDTTVIRKGNEQVGEAELAAADEAYITGSLGKLDADGRRIFDAKVIIIAKEGGWTYTPRVRPLKEIVDHRMRHAAGKETDDDLIQEMESRHGRGTDDAATHDAKDDHGTDNAATHDVGDDNGQDDPSTHDVGDDNSGNDSNNDSSGGSSNDQEDSL